MPLIKRDTKPQKDAVPIEELVEEAVEEAVEEPVEAAVLVEVDSEAAMPFVVERGGHRPPRVTVARRLAKPVKGYGGDPDREAGFEVKVGAEWKQMNEGEFWRKYNPLDRAAAKELRGAGAK